MTVVALHPSDDFAPHIGATARHFWGEPNTHLSTREELRFGSHGSRSVDLEKGTWFDHEVQEGGGVLDLVAREQGLKGRAAVEYLRDQLGLPVPELRQQRRIAKTYDYADENGEVLFQVVRFEPKEFRQRRPDPTSPDGWSWSVKGVRQVPYRLPEVIDALAMGRTVYIPEGEKDVDALWSIGVPATCNAGGAGKWPASFALVLAGGRFVILPDNDDAGRNHAEVVGANLTPVAESVSTVALPGLPPKGDVSDWIRAGGTAEHLHQLTAQAPAWRPAPPHSQFGAILWNDIKATWKPREPLVRDLLFPADIALAYGESGSGKSFLVIDLALSIARGAPFFGMPSRRGPVVYQAGEGAEGAKGRLLAYGIERQVDAEDLPFVFMRSRINLFARDGDVDAFITELLAWQAWFGEPVALVVIDTFSAATAGANENASEDVSVILSNAKKIKETTGAAVLFVHHKNAQGVRSRGHTSIYADADAAIDVERDEETKERHFTIRKVKDGEDGKKFGFRLQPVTIGAYDDGTAITSCVVAPAQADDSRTGDRSERKSLTPPRRIFLQVLRDVVLEKGGFPPGNVDCPDYTKAIDYAAFRDAYRAKRQSSDLDDDAIRQALKRDGDALLAEGLIGRHTPYVWLTSEGLRCLR